MREIKQLDDVDKILELPISYEEKGRLKEAKRVAREMLNEGLPVDLISRVTQLEPLEIEKMKY